MLFRKIESYILDYLKTPSNKVLTIDGARQIGKSFIIRHACQQLYKNYIEINFAEDKVGQRLFANVGTVEDFYLQLSSFAGDKMGGKSDTIIFLDEVQEYPQLLTLFKFLKADDKFNYIASGSLLGVTLGKTSSIPMGSIEIKQMYPLDFEEFLIANGVGAMAIGAIQDAFKARKSLDESLHNKVMDLFRKYLLVGGLPDAVNTFMATKNIVKVRAVQNDIHDLYGADATKYDTENRLKIRRIYDMLPSNMENKKKRVVVKDIEGKKGKRFSDYEDEFDYLINAGVALEVRAISTPTFPLIESSGKNLLKLYLNDVGLLTNILYRNNIQAIMEDRCSVNLGSVYECVVASELKAHGHNLFYYDNKSKGEVDYLIDDYDALSVAPIEVKSGKDYTIHSALYQFVTNEDYHINCGYVLSNEREVKIVDKIIYMPIYYVMFFRDSQPEQIILD
ncbi:MAG: ATP-binding protein [Paludibacteraceae bacterium]|nr:ATP-binding protein [Paludibacteraceae bacterium]